METKNIRQQAKHRIDQLFNEIEELESQASEIADDQKSKWEEQMDGLMKTRETMQSLYDSLKDASDDSLEHLNKAFGEMSGVMERRIKKIKENYMEAVNA